MLKPKVFISLKNTMGKLHIAFKRQKMEPVFFLALVLTVLAIMFSFIFVAPLLSPFLYPFF